MPRVQDDTRLRGAIAAAAAVLGLPIELGDDDTWSISEDGTVHVGLEYVLRGAPTGADPSVNGAVAHTLVLLWESAREARVAPVRRARRLAMSEQHPSLEPALAAIDRMLAASEVVTAFPALRSEVSRVLVAGLPDDIGALPRHLQWISLLLASAIDPRLAVPMRSSLAPEVIYSLDRLEGVAGDSENVLRRSLSADPSRTPMQRFARAYAAVVPSYQSLLAQDLAEKGLATSAGTETLDDAASADLGLGTSGSDSDEAQPGAAAEDTASGEAQDTERAGQSRDGAEGADLFAAEQAGFVETVLATPLPADGDWPEGVQPPEIEAESHGTPLPTKSSGGGGGSPAAATLLAEYRMRANALSSHIDRLREVWRRVIAERSASRSVMSRRAEAEGEMLDRDALVRIVAEVTAGVERPRAFLKRETRRRRTQREGSTDYVLLIDRSASMQGAPAEAAADAAVILLESFAAVARDIAAEERALGIDLELSVRTALLVFDSQPTVVKPLSQSLDDVVRRRMHAEIRSPRGSTNEAAALAAAAEQLGIGGARRGRSAGVERRRVVIVVSDGGTDDVQATRDQVQALRAAGVTVFGIGVRTRDLVTRYAPNGSRLDDPSLLVDEISRLVTVSGLETGRSR